MIGSPAGGLRRPSVWGTALSRGLGSGPGNLTFLLGFLNHTGTSPVWADFLLFKYAFRNRGEYTYGVRIWTSPFAFLAWSFQLV